MVDSSKNILIVDDEKGFRDSIAKRIRLMDLVPIKAAGGAAAIELARGNSIDLAIVDLNMPEMDGLVAISKLKQIQPRMRTILLTGYGNEKVKQAAEAIHAAYFEKDDMARFWAFLKKMGLEGGIPGGAGTAAAAFAPNQEAGSVASQAAGAVAPKPPIETLIDDPASADEYYRRDIHWLIGGTREMETLKKNIATAATIGNDIFIIGEDGSGKELVARSIHSLSQRSSKRFAAINCGTFASETMASELWGLAKPTVAKPSHAQIGLIKACDGGSILLDDIEKIPLSMQPQLLRLLRDKTIVPIGGQKEIAVDIRVMAASHTDLKQQAKQGEFDVELLQQLNAFLLRMPPLRKRKDDIAPLSSYFLDKYNKKYGKHVLSLSSEVLSLFHAYPFPGNVQELSHLIERAVVLTSGDKIKPKHLPARFKTASSATGKTPDQMMTLAEMETKYIIEVLEATGGNKSKAVEVLGISRGALWRKLKRINQKK